MRHATVDVTQHTIPLSQSQSAVYCMIFFTVRPLNVCNSLSAWKYMRRNSVSLSASDAASHNEEKSIFALRPALYTLYCYICMLSSLSSGSVRRHGATTTAKPNPNNDVCSMQWSTSMIHFVKSAFCCLPSSFILSAPPRLIRMLASAIAVLCRRELISIERARIPQNKTKRAEKNKLMGWRNSTMMGN